MIAKITGQRGFVALVTVLLLILGAALGSPGSYPRLPSGNLLDPQVLEEILAAVLVPIGVALTSLKFIFDSINNRVQAGEINPGDLLAPFKMPDFWVYVVVIVSSAAQFFGVEILQDEAAQTELANALAVIGAFVLRTWGNRPSTNLTSHESRG